MKTFLATFIQVLCLCLVASGQTAKNAPASTPLDTALGSRLETALEQKNLNQITVLLDEGAPINARLGTGSYLCPPLIMAVKRSLEITKYLISKGADLNGTDSLGNTPLNICAIYHKNDCALALLNVGADPNIKNANDHCAIMEAAKRGNDALVTALLAHHADVNVNGVDFPAIWWTVGNDHLSTVKLLIDAGADLNLVPPYPADPKSDGFTLLSMAVATGDIELIDLLLTHRMNINGTSKDGTTPLMTAVSYSNAHDAKAEIVAHLLEKGANPNLQNNLGETALIQAVLYADQITIQSLLDHHSKLELKDYQGHTALILAGLHISGPIIRLLIDRGADINATDNQGETPLTYAGDRGAIEIVQLLKDKGAKRTDVHIIAKDKPATPLSPAHAWALATTALYAQTNSSNPYLLGGGDRDTEKEARENLKEQWEVTDKATLLKEIRAMSDTGSRWDDRANGAKLAALSDADFAKLVASTPLMAVETTVIRSSYLKWKDRSGLAGDLCRATNMINWGYRAQYINEKEAWGLLMPIARQLQGGFKSWREMSDNFLDAREIWTGERDPRFEACAHLLLDPKEPNSPWNQIPWTTDLSAN